MATKYVVITPVRNEEEYIASTIESMLGQTVQPAEWVIVDDGSTDGTRAIIEEYASKNPWIRLKAKADRGFRHPGAGVVEAFYEGYDSLVSQRWEFVVKLDGDLALGPDYFQQLFDRFSKEPQLGIAGGGIYHSMEGNLHLERCPRFHVRGATKVYRKECWEQIDPLLRAPGWDTVDEVKATMLGWKTESFPDLQVIHHRITGTAESHWKGLVKDGRADYCSGYHPLFMAVKCMYRVLTKPYIVRSVGLATGFISGYLGRIPRVNDPLLVAFIRRQQLRRLFGMETVWK